MSIGTRYTVNEAGNEAGSVTEVLPSQLHAPEKTKAERRAELAILRQHRPSMVYFYRCEGFIKIGYTRDPYNRLHACQVGNPFPVTLAAMLTGDIQEEEKLQGKFAKLRHRNEWYREEGALAELLAVIGPMAPDDARNHIDIHVFKDGKARRRAMSRRWKLEAEEQRSHQPQNQDHLFTGRSCEVRS